MTNLFFIALLTPEAVAQKIIALQKTVSEKYHSNHSLKSPPHVTLMPPFKYDGIFEKDINNPLMEFFLRSSPFTIQLEDFSCFEKNRVIFINVIKTENVNRLFSGLTEFVKNNLPTVLPHQHPTFTPHITIASRDLRKEMFRNAWNEFKEKTFQETWAVKSAFLLQHTGKEWIPVLEFKFSEN